ncbi:RNA polymerase sigma factor [Pontibacter locisalis]|uniref:RNA polymerase sigma factor n=1 Tax=Pontibacter locisalis TaxID=1719035 RepID=A0ABW5IFW1_9BACT
MSGTEIRREAELSLIEALKQGRQEVMGQLYDAYAPVLMGMISRIVEDTEVAEEVLQETFVAIWSRIGVYDSTKSRFLIWSLAIARGIALQAVNSGKLKGISLNGQQENNKAKENTQSRVEEENRFNLRSVLSLEPQERAVLELVYLKGRSCSEAAKELGLTEQQLVTSLKKAFILLKQRKQA